jgi:hypothetical protein
MNNEQDLLRISERKQVMNSLTRLLCGIIAVASLGCGDPATDSASGPEPQQASVSFSILWQTPSQDATFDHTVSQLDNCPVENVQCKVYSDGMALSSHTWSCSDHRGSIDDIPPGPNRQFIIFGLDDMDRITFRGQSDGNYDFSPGENINIGRIEASTFVPNLLGPADGTIANFADLTLTWDAVEGASEYHVTVSENSDFSDPITEYTAPDANCTPSELTIAKTYYWRVCAVDAHQNRGMASVFSAFNLTGYQLPDTGQTNSSIVETYGEDADYTIYPPLYTKLDENGNTLEDTASEWVMVEDAVTGLVWEVKTVEDGSINDSGNSYTWDDIPDQFIAQLNQNNFGGRSNWRLPNIRELATLVNYGEIEPAINTRFFPNTQSGKYWSISESAANPSTHAWAVYFASGSVSSTDEHHSKSTPHYVRAVSGERAGYDLNNVMVVNNASGTLTDQRTGLMWQRGGAVANTWIDALTHCETLESAGYDDWRLPNLRELHSIVDFNRQSPSADQTYFPDIGESAVFWSSTRVVTQTATPDNFNVWRICFDDGSTCTANGQTAIALVRAVRGGQ